MDGIVKSRRTDVVDKALKLGDQIDGRLVGLGRYASGGAAALPSHVAVDASLDVVVGDVAAIRGLVPDGVALDIGARRLARDGHSVALGVGLLDSVASARAGAAVDRVSSDGIGGGDGGDHGGGDDGENGELHGEGFAKCGCEVEGKRCMEKMIGNKRTAEGIMVRRCDDVMLRRGELVVVMKTTSYIYPSEHHGRDGVR